eukprot:TRINITY_DN14541_c0_g1_i2.p1 TRINITY_DN14541_c0_g1~~TRINITY_DN14541_c0_g1_i2.p1  ORF type:complete len:411 (+),score=31.16 TRINITY_DN14541_c0_g1_i2:285-1517(+)
MAPEGSFDSVAVPSDYINRSRDGLTQRAVDGGAKDSKTSATGAPAFVNTDIGSARHEYAFKPPGFVQRWLVAQLLHPKDAPITFFMFNVLTTTLPAAALVFYLTTPWLGGQITGWKANLLGAAYMITNYVLYMQRFMLTLHFSEHVPTFKKTVAGRFFSVLLPNIVAPFFGMPPGFYRLHHCVMHHVENNLASHDLSSTEPFQRDNFFHFCLYWWRFLFCAIVEMPYYAFSHGRTELFVQAMIFLVPYASLLCLLPYAPVGLTWVYLGPFVLSSFLMMFGNWSQHIFIDPRNPRSNYALTYNCVNSPDNQKSYNDGYHILHHLNSQIHWLDLPVRFMETMDIHAKEDAIIFKTLHFMDVGILVFTGQLRKLAKYYVNIGQPQRTEDELVEMFKERLKPIHHAGDIKAKAK